MYVDHVFIFGGNCFDCTTEIPFFEDGKTCTLCFKENITSLHFENSLTFVHMIKPRDLHVAD